MAPNLFRLHIARLPNRLRTRQQHSLSEADEFGFDSPGRRTRHASSAGGMRRRAIVPALALLFSFTHHRPPVIPHPRIRSALPLLIHTSAAYLLPRQKTISILLLPLATRYLSFQQGICLSTGYQPPLPATSYQPLAASHQPPAISHQPPVACLPYLLSREAPAAPFHTQ